MKFKVEFDTENAAFEEDGGVPEIVRVLRDIADNIDEQGCSPGSGFLIRDVNGNRIGEWEWVR